MDETVKCGQCGSTFNKMFLLGKQGNADVCPLCGANLCGDSTNKAEGHSDWITWYYYGFLDENGKKNKGSATLESKPIDLQKFGDKFYLIQEFQAPPREAKGNEEFELTKAELRKYVPDAFTCPPKPQIMCPRCFSTEFQLVPKRFSILTGFATNQYNRVCNRCGNKF